jgi:N-carbamoylputrescine amidase
VTLSLAAIQMSMSENTSDNVAKAEHYVREAAAGGSRIILIPELFEDEYFCKDLVADHLKRALPLDENPTITHFQKIAKELNVVLPLSVFERAGNTLFNTVVMVDADGSRMGIYRKSHIPDGPGYTEKYFFSPGDTGFRVWNTQHGRVGVGICWDQWFPEAARAMALAGAQCIIYPTAIGSEPADPSWDSSRHWQRVMQGHAAANIIPVMAANRVGYEKGSTTEITFYGSSFIADYTGEIVAEAGRDTEEVISAEFDDVAIEALRTSWGLFRDRRPDLYGSLLSLDGNVE